MKVREIDDVDALLRGHFGDDWLSDQLPGALAGDPFMRRFVRIFQDVIDPLRWTADHLEHYVTPALAPAGALPWIARWLDLPLDTTQSEEEQRLFLSLVAKQIPYRGTCGAVQTHLDAFIDGTVTVAESGEVIGSCLPANIKPSVQQARPRSVMITITSDHVVDDDSIELGEALTVGGDQSITRAKLRVKDVKALVEELVPIGTLITLVVHPLTTTSPGDDDER